MALRRASLVSCHLFPSRFCPFCWFSHDPCSSRLNVIVWFDLGLLKSPRYWTGYAVACLRLLHGILFLAKFMEVGTL